MQELSNYILIVTFVVIFIVIAFFIILAMYFSKTGNSENNNDINKSTLNIPKENQLTQQDVYNKIVEMICTDFRKIGWDMWKPEIHSSKEQLDRIKRASDSHNHIRLKSYSRRTTTGIVYGSSGNTYLTCGNGCSCPDFKKRGLPCKHMYFISMVHDEYKSSKVNNNDYVPYGCESNVFKGLKFCVVGKNQKAVKEYITKHSGLCSDYSWYSTDALIINGETTSKKVLEAQENNVMIMTFEELQALYDDIAPSSNSTTQEGIIQ